MNYYIKFSNYFLKDVTSHLINEYFCNTCQKWFYEIKKLKNHYHIFHSLNNYGNDQVLVLNYEKCSYFNCEKYSSMYMNNKKERYCVIHYIYFSRGRNNENN